MEEGAFARPGRRRQYTFYSEQDWLHQVTAMRHLRHIRALMLVHACPLPRVGPFADGRRRRQRHRGWQALWFGLNLVFAGYNDVRQNAYLGFTVWGYTSANVFWLDEFDPAHLNLGRALGESRRVDAAIGHCYLREFDAGWAVVNPTDTLAQGVPVPKGEARVLDHDTFEHPQDNRWSPASICRSAGDLS